MSSSERIVLFVCAENSFRSQMAEAYFNAMAPPGWRAVSAGSKPAERVHPNAVRLMLEEGIDISVKRPRPLTPELQSTASIGIIVCGESESGTCPTVYTRYVEHWEIPDPARMSLEEARKVRDEIKRRVIDLVERIKSGEVPPARGRRLRLKLS
uniref:Arsenate reductase ArsC n=1 Tax=Thermofilum pendens TaxID=2269 RepID=A0A7C3WQR7_THEPE